MASVCRGAAREPRRLSGRLAGRDPRAGDLDRPEQRRRLRPGAALARARDVALADGPARRVGVRDDEVRARRARRASRRGRDPLRQRLDRDDGRRLVPPRTPAATATSSSSARSAPRGSSRSTSSATTSGSTEPTASRRSPSSTNQAFFYNCDGPPNTLVDLALGKDVAELLAGRARRPDGRDPRRRLPERGERPARGGGALTARTA